MSGMAFEGGDIADLPVGVVVLYAEEEPGTWLYRSSCLGADPQPLDRPWSIEVARHGWVRSVVWRMPGRDVGVYRLGQPRLAWPGDVFRLTHPGCRPSPSGP